MMRPDAKVEKVYLYPKPVDFRKSIDGLSALVELDIKVAVFDPVLFVFLNRHRNRVKILYWERNGFCLWLKRLESERFKTSPDLTDEAIVLTVQELDGRQNGLEVFKERVWLFHGWPCLLLDVLHLFKIEERCWMQGKYGIGPSRRKCTFHSQDCTFHS